MEKGDVKAYLECFTEETQEIIRPNVVSEKLTPEVLKTLFELHYKWGAEFKVTEKTSDRVVMAEETATLAAHVFKKEKGNWKIDLMEGIKKANDARRVSNLRQIEALLELYQHRGYPVLTDTSEDGEFLEVLIDEVYMPKMLLDPLHPKYFYEYEGTENSYTLKCYCELEGANCDMEDGIKDHALIITFP